MWKAAWFLAGKKAIRAGMFSTITYGGKQRHNLHTEGIAFNCCKLLFILYILSGTADKQRDKKTCICSAEECFKQLTFCELDWFQMTEQSTWPPPPQVGYVKVWDISQGSAVVSKLCPRPNLFSTRRWAYQIAHHGNLLALVPGHAVTFHSSGHENGVCGKRHYMTLQHHL